MEVDLKEWEKENVGYLITWVSMGVVLFGLVIWKLGIDTIILIIPYLPLLAIALWRWRKEVN